MKSQQGRFSTRNFIAGLIGWLFIAGGVQAGGAEMAAPDEGSLKWTQCGGYPPGCEEPWFGGSGTKALMAGMCVPPRE